MPPKFVVSIFKYLIISIIIAALIFGGLELINLKNGGAILNPNTTPAPTVDVTKIAEYTPTPGPSSAQMATAVALAKPTPYVAWSPADADKFIAAMRDKAIISMQDINVGAELSSPGEGHVCIDLKTIFDIKLDTYCKVSLTWTEWYLSYKPQEMVIKVEPGKMETDTSKMPLSADGSHYIARPYAKVTITIPSIGLLSPGTRFDQSYNFYQDVNAVWKLTMDLKQILTGDDLRNKANELTADSTNLALADSFAPLLSDQSRSAEYSDQLYADFVTNLTTPGAGHIYNRLLDYAQLIANDHSTPCTTEATKDQNAVCDAGFAGLESLTVIVPNKPATPCSYVYAEDMTTLVLPGKYCTFTSQTTGLSDSAKKDIAAQILAQMQTNPNTTVDYSALLLKILKLP